jgi:hypothetical protein
LSALLVGLLEDELVTPEELERLRSRLAAEDTSDE